MICKRSVTVISKAETLGGCAKLFGLAHRVPLVTMLSEMQKGQVAENIGSGYPQDTSAVP
jgi:hypothetical protein